MLLKMQACAPQDVVEIGSATIGMGDVVGVKPLGALSMIDDGELDWKVIAVATDDPLAKEYNDIDDVPFTRMPLMQSAPGVTTVFCDEKFNKQAQRYKNQISLPKGAFPFCNHGT